MHTPHGSPVPDFPQHRPRRLRRLPLLREAVADVALSPANLICPLFVGAMTEAIPVASMPGVSQLPVDQAVDRVRSLSERGLRQFILFGVTEPNRKDAEGTYALSPDAPVNRTLKAVRDAGLDVVMYADLCFCEYTTHGHCGVLIDGVSAQGGDPAIVDNDRTLDMLRRTAVVQAEAGADVIAPSGMVDGMVGAIRGALDGAGHTYTAILSYAIKYASSFYGPFRDAGEGGMTFGDRRSYQMDYRRSREWRVELMADLQQGADMVMVKPAATYLDVVKGVRESCDVPVAAYHVSGEYAMLHAAAEKGWLNLKDTAMETTYAIRRAGADLIVTYFAPELVEWLGG
ncbi:MAG: porphobilinogen synthase [Phycisphaeraceae bacterium]